MWKPLALVAICCAVVGSQIAQADEGNPSSPIATASTPCTPLKQIYSLNHWREKHPAKGENPCRSTASKKLKARFFDYKLYRQVAPFHGPNGSGPRGPADGRWWAIPWHIVCGESDGNFRVNADGAYQIIPSTWASAGGTRYAATAGLASPMEQHIIAHHLWGHTAWYGDCG